MDEQASLTGLLEDVNVANAVKYDFKVSGLQNAPEGIEFSIGEEPVFWEDFGNLKLPDGKVKEPGDAALVVRQHQSRRDLATLPETAISGPVELWFRESPNMRLALPHDVEAGPLNRVVVAEGTTVTIVGASRISLARPLKLPLPPTVTPKSSSVKDTASLLRIAARQSEKPLVSLVVVGANALVSRSPVEENVEADAARLRVKRLSASALEVSARRKQSQDLLPAEMVGNVWPFSNLLATDDRIRAVETAVRGLAGDATTFNLLKAEASAFKLVRMQLNLEKKLPHLTRSEKAVLEKSDQPDSVDSEQQTWEVMVKVDGKSRPEPLSARRVGGVSEGTVSLSWSVATGNGTIVAREPSMLNTVGLMDLEV